MNIRILSIVFIPVMLLDCELPPTRGFEPNNLQENETGQTDPLISYDCITREQAEKILGQAARLTESTSDRKINVTQSKCTYTATSKDIKTNETGNLYYMLELYDNAVEAQQTYSDILKSNEGMSGQSRIQNIGEEAWEHTDNKNFYLLMVRKENKIIRVKINKITSLTSEEALEDIVREIALKI